MEGREILAGKGPIIIKILRIFVALGWIAFVLYNLHLVKSLGQDYTRDPSDFVFFNSSDHREAYRSTQVYSSAWIDEASLMDQCKPMIYFNDFYFDKIDPIINWMFLLIVLTIAIRIPVSEWKMFRSKLKKISEKLEDDDDDEK